jgi:hypothetical protein
MMRKLSILLLAASALPLSACAVTSFAPPSVPMRLADGTMLSGECLSSRTGRRSAVTLTRNVDGALRYVDEYNNAIACSRDAAANGRQGFEVPSFIVTTGAMVAAAFGAGPDVAIAGSAGNSVLNAGKAYYDPKQKAAIYGNAVDALGCIRSEAVGMTSFAAIKDDSDAGAGLKTFMDGSTGTVTVTTDMQYFAMVTDAVNRVRDILAKRLSDVGTFDPKGLATEFAANAEEIRAREEEKKAAAPADDPTGSKAFFSDTDTPLRDQLIQLDLAALQPKLQQCIWRAKV